MILQTETTLTTEQYNDVQNRPGDLAAKITLQRYGPVWTTLPLTMPTAIVSSGFDAILVGDYIVKIEALRGFQGSSLVKPYVFRFPITAKSGDLWTEVPWNYSKTTANYTLSLAASGVSCSMFFEDGTNIYVATITDIATGSFDAPAVVVAVANVAKIAAVSPTKVYYLTDESDYNRRFHCAEYIDAAWVVTSSDVYWPFSIDSMDAVAMDDCDLIGITTDISPLWGTRVVGTTVSNEFNRVQALVYFKVKNSRWSDWRSIDIQDRDVSPWSRTSLRMSFYNDIVFSTYARHSTFLAAGSSKYRYTDDRIKPVVSRSKDGDNWEFAEITLDVTTAGNNRYPSVIVPCSEGVYCVSLLDVIQSPVCLWAGQTPDEEDISDYAVGYSSQAADIRTSSCELANRRVFDGALTTKLANSLAMSVDRVMAKYKLGYTISGEKLLPQVSLEDIVARKESAGLPRRSIALQTSDVLGRVNRTISDYAAEWPTQQSGRDSFIDETGTGYGGLKHMAAYEGNWKAQLGEMEFLTRNARGINVSTFVQDALNGSAQVGFALAYTDKGEYAGVTFRILDKDNYFFVAYYPDTDVIKLCKCLDAVDTVLATSNAMSWSGAVTTAHYIKVVVRYSLVSVYTSTDCVTWTTLAWASGSAQLPGCQTGATDYVQWSGKFGVIGLGWAEEAIIDWTPDPWVPPVPPIIERNIVVVSNDHQIGSTETFFNDPPTWVNIKTGDLANTAGDILCFAVSNSGDAWLCTHGGDPDANGIYFSSDVTVGNWTLVKSETEIAADTSSGGGYAETLAVDSGGRVWIPITLGRAYPYYGVFEYYTGISGSLSWVTRQCVPPTDPGASRGYVGGKQFLCGSSGTESWVGIGSSNDYTGYWNFDTNSFVPFSAFPGASPSAAAPTSYLIAGGSLVTPAGTVIQTGASASHPVVNAGSGVGGRQDGGGGMAYWIRNADGYLMQGSIVFAIPNDVGGTSGIFGTGNALAGGFATCIEPTEVIWVSRAAAANNPKRSIAYTGDGGNDGWWTKDGNWETVMGAAWIASTYVPIVKFV